LYGYLSSSPTAEGNHQVACSEQAPREFHPRTDLVRLPPLRDPKNGLWLDRSIIVPAAGRRRTGSCPAFADDSIAWSEECWIVFTIVAFFQYLRVSLTMAFAFHKQRREITWRRQQSCFLSLNICANNSTFTYVLFILEQRYKKEGW